MSFPDVEAKYHDGIRKMLAPFADMCSRKRGSINAVKHRIQLTPNNCPFRTATYRAGPKLQELEELEVQKHLKAVVVETTTPE